MSKENTPQADDRSRIEDYLSKYSDFSFEVKVFQKMSQLGFDCQHSGTYVDPQTQKVREFDLRASKEFRKNIHVRLAIECKNIIQPLVVHCVKRTAEESYFEYIVMPEREHETYLRFNLVVANALNYRAYARNSIYPTSRYVGKGMDQLSEKKQPNDSIVFEKMSQAVSSCVAMLPHDNLPEDDDEIYVILPFLVVPDDMLWVVHYDETGKIVKFDKSESVSYWIDRKVSNGKTLPSISLSVSHLEIITFSSLEKFIEDLFPNDKYESGMLVESEKDFRASVRSYVEQERR